MSDNIQHAERAMNYELLQVGGHTVSVATIAGALFGWLPYFAALLGIIWYLIQIYESRTFQHWKNNRLMKYRAKKLAKLRAREKITLAQIAALEKVRHAKVEAREMVAEATAEAAALVVTKTAESEVAAVTTQLAKTDSSKSS